MQTLGSAFADVSVLEGKAKVGVYYREGGSFAMRLQLEGTAGTFVSPEFLGQQFGTEMIEELKRAAMRGFAKLEKRTPSARRGRATTIMKSFDVGEFQRSPIVGMKRTLPELGTISSLREFGVQRAGSLPIKGGIRTKTSGVAKRLGSRLTVTGQVGQTVILANKLETFQKSGPLAINPEMDIAVKAIMLKLVAGIKKIAAQVVQERVYETKAQTTTRFEGKTLGSALESASVTKDSPFYGYFREGTLKAAVVSGIRPLGDFTGFIIGVDEEMLQSEAGVNYWMFVEHGHRVVVPAGKSGGVTDTGEYVVGRPFMQEINEQAKVFIESFIQKLKVSNLQKRLGDMVFTYLTNVRGEVGADQVDSQMFLGSADSMELPYGQSASKTPLSGLYEASI